MEKAMSEKWTEEIYDEVYKMGYKFSEKLFSKTSEFQKVEVYKTDYLGNVLFNDGLVMVSEKDEFVYHEMMAHVALSVHPDPRKVLIIGGGDGGTAREVLKHKNVEKVVMVEIDGVVVEACKEFLPITANDLDSPRLELRIEDGVKYINETSEVFDVILVDSTDPIGPATPLFGHDFYSQVYKTLSDKGVVVSQCESPFLHLEVQKSMLEIFNEIFQRVSIFNYSNLTYPGGLWSFSFASKGLDPILDYKSVITEDMDLKYYNSQIHKSAFALPNFQKQALKDVLK